MEAWGGGSTLGRGPGGGQATAGEEAQGVAKTGGPGAHSCVPVRFFFRIINFSNIFVAFFYVFESHIYSY